MEPGIKKCSKCGEVKSLVSFSKDARSADGKCARCKTCAKIRADLYFIKHKAQVLATTKVYRDLHKKQVSAYQRAYRERHLEEDRERSRAYAAEHIEEACVRSRAWGAANWERKYERNASRRAKKLQATPAWANSAAIAEIYAEAGVLSISTGIKHHVDHIVPLKSKLVSGLHVEFNLRPLPKRENLSKGNRTWPDMP